jgi:hypothetical protein
MSSSYSADVLDLGYGTVTELCRSLGYDSDWKQEGRQRERVALKTINFRKKFVLGIQGMAYFPLESDSLSVAPCAKSFLLNNLELFTASHKGGISRRWLIYPREVL